jgi:hypothetical protein
VTVSAQAAAAPAAPSAEIRQPWLGLVRVAWPLAAAMQAGILLASLPGYLQVTATPYPIDASPELIAALNALGSLASFFAAALSLGLAGLLYWRKPNEKMAVFVSFALLAYGVVVAGPLERLPLAWPQLGALNPILMQQLFFTTPFVVLFGIFPDGRFVPGWMRWAALASLALIPVSLAAPCCNFASTNPWLVGGLMAAWIVLVGVGLYAQVYRYRRVSSPAQRQQTRWVVYGLMLMVGWFAISTLPFLMTENLPPDTPRPAWSVLMGTLWWLSLIILPASLTIAVLRFRLFDLDVIIRRTLAYTVLTGLLAAVYWGSVVVLQRLFTAAGGQQSTAAIVISTLIIAALFNPLRQRVKDAIDRRFYRRAYDAQQVLAAFGQAARDEVELDALTDRLLAAVEEAVQPEHAWVWHRRHETPDGGGRSSAAVRRG